MDTSTREAVKRATINDTKVKSSFVAKGDEGAKAYQ